MLARRAETNLVALHIRHGDNADPAGKAQGVLPVDYYCQAPAPWTEEHVYWWAAWLGKKRDFYPADRILL